MIALGASLTRTPYGQHLQGPRKTKFKIHNSVNADDINKDETADIALHLHAPIISCALGSE